MACRPSRGLFAFCCATAACTSVNVARYAAIISCLAIAVLSGVRDGVGEAVVGDADGSSVARAPCEQPLAARATAMAAAAAHAGRRGMDTVKPSHSGNSAANCAIAALGAKSTCELSRPLYPGSEPVDEGLATRRSR